MPGAEVAVTMEIGANGNGVPAVGSTSVVGRRVIVNWRSSRITICSGQKSYSELEEQ